MQSLVSIEQQSPRRPCDIYPYGDAIYKLHYGILLLRLGHVGHGTFIIEETTRQEKMRMTMKQSIKRLGSCTKHCLPFDHPSTAYFSLC